MTPRDIDLREQAELAPASAESVISQRKRPELGRYLLQVDRQTKKSFTTLDAARKAGMVIKKESPRLRVAVYDPVDSENTVIEIPDQRPDPE